MKAGKIEGTDNVCSREAVRDGKFYVFGQLSTTDGKSLGEINAKFGKASSVVQPWSLSSCSRKKNQSNIK